MIIDSDRISKAKECLKASIKLIEEGKNEDVIRHSFGSYLRSIFSDNPSWLERHIEGGEAAVKFEKDGMKRTGFVDNLVDYTAIEYESNLTKRPKFEEGYGQVEDYCASLLNKGIGEELIIGVLSDTIRWRAYKIKSLSVPASGVYGRDHIELELLERIDLGEANETAAKKFILFLEKYLGRIGSRPLNAHFIAKDIGVSSRFCELHINSLKGVVDKAYRSNSDYGKLIEELWDRFVGYLRDDESSPRFNIETYIDELYVLILAELICSNIIQEKALISDDNELMEILHGEFYKNKGLLNLVEYDYFGWLKESPFIEQLIPIARDIQYDLQAYDFSKIPDEDLFGQMMSELAVKNRRLLLGQEWTPNWLARTIVEKVISELPDQEEPRLIDMCCGSGAFLIEAIKLSKKRIEDKGEPDEQVKRIQLLTETITGFDIDPLAVMLSKINWVIASRDWLKPYGSHEISIPVYQADSLFAITPVSNIIQDEEGQESYELRIANDKMELPAFLISPGFQLAFDNIIDYAYRLALLDDKTFGEINDAVLEASLDEISNQTSTTFNSSNKESAKNFLLNFSTIVHKLDSKGINGIWAFLLRNSYRPGLVTGQFNGIVSNPPWLALSKIADNPYKDVLKRKAKQFGIQPPGASFLHVEMATIFILHAVDKYLKDDGIIGCISPETILKGLHHNPFREYNFASAERPIKFALTDIYRIQDFTFKNKGIILFGKKEQPIIGQPNPIPGQLAEEGSLTPLTFYRIVQGNRSAWSEENIASDKDAKILCADFKQGVDIMPRTTFFHETRPSSVGKFGVKPIDTSSSSLSYLINDSKKCKSFRLNPCVLPEELFFDVLISKHLTPLDIASPAKALLPISKNSAGEWKPISKAMLTSKGARVANAFTQISTALGSTSGSIDVAVIWDLIDTRNKLSQQIIKTGGYIVLSGTSGGIVCSAWKRTDDFDVQKLIIDQTLNWVRVDSEEEAFYLTGCLNSEAINTMIKNFQPEGAFGRRHIHTLPYKATPPYDSSNPFHQEVVEKTKHLMKEYESIKKTDAELINLLDPNKSSLASKRRKIKTKIKELPSYGDYERACEKIYGLPDFQTI